MSQPSCGDPAFRHPDTPKRAGDTDQWRRGPAAPGWDVGSPALRDPRASDLRTPGRTDGGALGSTADGAATPAHVNPFECDDMMTSLSLPTSSPSLFERVQSPDKEEPGLGIEHRAQLFPAQIELTPSTYHKQLMAQHYDPHKEVQVQTAIERFFNSEKIVPSPWSAGPQRRVLPPAAGLQESPLAAAGPGPLLRHCAVQTELSLPARLPAELERALAPYLRGAADRSSSPQEDDSMLSNSTLRRRLLFHNAGAGELASADVSMADPDTSVYHFPDSPDKGHLVPTSPPSPGGARASEQHRTDVESPPVSPIAKSMLDSPSTSSIKSQGLARIRYPSSDLSEADCDEPTGVECFNDRHDSSAAACAGGGPGAAAAVGADGSLPGADDSAPQDTGYHSTLTSLPSLSARHLAAAESSQLARLIGSGSASMLASTRLDEPSVLTAPAEDEGRARPPVPIGSSTPSRSQRR
ncbi:protein aurora borealis-like [Amphibalanus amphitrite]|uniref:protein aurora borealis-like n=1 Tax=Amphibalanus amphitrite TaxID=1232801 RepID=UPI001C8FB47A|nr:protein aurora borealis-like [Amphibalanus amphitrite]XP_043228222.1 protein aurora borealis-like [Amphibalanus amphitrite]